MCFVRISEQTATFALYCINWLVFITEVESVYCAVRFESLYKTDTIRLRRVNVEMFTGILIVSSLGKSQCRDVASYSRMIMH